MAFNKAVLKRFNDITNCTPPPTKYTPKLPFEKVNNFVTPTKPVVTQRPPISGKSTSTPTAQRSTSDCVRKEDRLNSNSRNLFKENYAFESSPSPSSVEKKVADQSQKVRQLKGVIGSMKTAGEKLRFYKEREESKEGLLKENSALKTRVALLEDTLKQKTTKSEENEVKLSELEQLYEQRLRELECASDEIETQKNVVTSVTEELRSCIEKQEMSDSRIEELLEENATLKESLAQLEADRKEKDGVHEECLVWKEMEKSLEARIEDLTRENNALKETQQRFLVQKAEFEKIYNKTKSDLEALEINLKSTQTTRSSLENEFKFAKSELEAKQSEVDKIETSYNFIRSEYRTAQEALREAKKEIRAKEILIADLKKVNEENKRELLELREYVNRLQKKLGEKNAVGDPEIPTRNSRRQTVDQNLEGTPTDTTTRSGRQIKRPSLLKY